MDHYLAPAGAQVAPGLSRNDSCSRSFAAVSGVLTSAIFRQNLEVHNRSLRSLVSYIASERKL
jgi:hypothetical protein